MNKYMICECETGRVLEDGIESFDKAKETVNEYEDGDLSLGVYTPNYYNVVKYN